MSKNEQSRPVHPEVDETPRPRYTFRKLSDSVLWDEFDQLIHG